jgi:hypothetical protein
MTCAETRVRLSSYLDGAVTGQQMQATREHLASCQKCSAEFGLLQQTQQLVTALGPKKSPANLELKLRVALSREAARSRERLWNSLSARLSNALDAFMVPATAGVLSAIICFGLLIGFFALPPQLQASGNDVPTMLYTPPELRFSPFEMTLGNINDGSLVVEASIDPNGRVQDYRVLSAPRDAQAMLPQLKNMLIFTVFRPATSFGRPVNGRTVLSFSKVNVKG